MWAKIKLNTSYLTDSCIIFTFKMESISKNKIQLEEGMDVDGILRDIQSEYSNNEIDTTDGVKIYFEKEWVHLRKSNTEPIIRIYSESESEEKANELAHAIMDKIRTLA